MAYLAAANVTVTLLPQDIEYVAGRIFTFPTVAFGNASLQYPSLGIPMPVIAKFGMKKEIKRAFIEQPANGFIYSFDRANQKLRIFLGAARDAITVANHINLQIGAPTVANHIDLAIAAPANHSHNLIVAANGAGAPVDMVGVNVANQSLTTNTANVGTIVGGNATLGGVQEGAVPAPANMANLVHSVGAPANMANLVHTVTGGGAVAEAALAEMDDGVAPAATTLYMQIIGQ